MNGALYKLRRWRGIWLERFDLRRIVSQSQNELRVILGAGFIEYDNWILTDFPVLDVTNKGNWKFLFTPSSISNLLAEHVLEHLTADQVQVVFGNCYSFLKPGGVFRVAVPDSLHPNQRYIDFVKPGGIGAGADDHKSFWNYRTLTEISSPYNFKIRFLEFWDEKGKFHGNYHEDENGPIRRNLSLGHDNEIDDYSSLIIDFIKN